MLRNGLLWLVRWPATTTLPTWPGRAVPGQCPGPLSRVDRAMPSNRSAATSSFGISMWPMSSSGSLASSAGGAIGVGSVVGAAVVAAAAVMGIVVVATVDGGVVAAASVVRGIGSSTTVVVVALLPEPPPHAAIV